ncbi:MAG: hypothetical protein ABFS43_00815 [Thermodesulfobacteriota bacterium]
MKTHKKIIIQIFTLIMVLLFSGTAFSNGNEKTIPLNVNPGLNHLLDMATPGNSAAFNPEIIAPVLDFVASQKSPDAVYVSDKSFKSPSAYIEVDLNQGLAELLRVSYNPDIPSYIMTPSSMRLSYWKEISQGKESFAELWNLLGDYEAPIAIRGVETVENTPDIHTGAYYKYDLERTMILFKHEGRKVFVSLSRQLGNSMVGKKGVVLGDDGDWNYLYSGEKGINKFGLGWVDSYMYESSSIIVYYETDPGSPLLRCAVFKWLKAGWKDINMVKNHHIYKGMHRWAVDYKSIMEHPDFPDADTLEHAWEQIERLELTELQRANHLYYQSLKKRYNGDRSVSSKWVSKVLEDDSRVATSDVHELRSVLVMEYLKSVLGKQYEIDVVSLYHLDSGQMRLSRK